jgi:hypothetical protein
MRALIFLLLLPGCLMRGASTDTAAGEGIESPRPTIILRQTSWIDDSLAARRLGRLEIVARVADRPTNNISSTGRVLIRQAGHDVRAPRNLDERGMAGFDSLPIGQYEVIVRAMGYAGARVVVPLFPGCRTDVEAYVGIMAVGIAPPPPEKSRIRITTCRDERIEGRR